MATSAASLALAALTVTAVCALVYAERSHRVALRRIAKCGASLGFVLVGLTRAPSAWSEASTWMVAGLALGAVGDATLLGSSQAAFLGGLSVFLLGHVAYVVGFAKLAEPSLWLSPYVVPVTLFGGGVLAWLWPRLGPMRIPVVAYVAVICTMVVAAVAVLGVSVPASGLVALGAILFAASDVAVARERFVEDAFVNKAWGLPTYYAGQLCIAWAVGLA